MFFSFLLSLDSTEMVVYQAGLWIRIFFQGVRFGFSGKADPDPIISKGESGSDILEGRIRIRVNVTRIDNPGLRGIPKQSATISRKLHNSDCDRQTSHECCLCVRGSLGFALLSAKPIVLAR